MFPGDCRQIFPGLFNPEAFITATRQCVAQANSWSLEELQLDVCVADEAEKPSFDDCSFAVEGLKLFGAACRNNQLSISAEISTNLHLTRLRWIKKSDCKFCPLQLVFFLREYSQCRTQPRLCCPCISTAAGRTFSSLWTSPPKPARRSTSSTREESPSSPARLSTKLIPLCYDYYAPASYFICYLSPNLSKTTPVIL